MERGKRHRRLVGLIILSIFSFHLTIAVMHADDYVEDVYYWPPSASQAPAGTIAPNYNTRAKEIVFIDDSAAAQHPDTVRAVIR